MPKKSFGNPLAAATATTLDAPAVELSPPAPVVALRYDYSQIDEAERGATMHAAAEIKVHVRQSSERILKIGQLLLERKAVLPSGTFQRWLEVEFEGDLSYRFAAYSMSAYERFGGKSEIISLLSPSALMLLSGPSVPDKAIEQILETAKEAGTGPTQAEVKAAMAQHRQGPRALTVVECEAVITRVLERAAIAPAGQHEALLHHTDPEDYAQAINGDNVTMRRKEFNQAYENVKRRLQARIAPPVTKPRPDTEQAVARSNPRVAYMPPETSETPLEHAFQQEPSISADALETAQGTGIAQAEQPELTAHECRQRDIQAELDFWREALRRVDRIGELIGIYKHSAPIRREIEPAIKLLKENLLP